MAKDNQKLSKRLSKGFERWVYSNKYKTKIKNTTNEFIYFLESHFIEVNRLFVLVYTNEGNSAKRYNTQKYSLPKGRIKNYNAIINGKKFYDYTLDSDTKQWGSLWL